MALPSNRDKLNPSIIRQYGTASTLSIIKPIITPTSLGTRSAPLDRLQGLVLTANVAVMLLDAQGAGQYTPNSGSVLSRANVALNNQPCNGALYSHTISPQMGLLDTLGAFHLLCSTFHKLLFGLARQTHTHITCLVPN